MKPAVGLSARAAAAAGIVLALACLGAGAQTPTPVPASERFAVCLACHGPGGVSAQALTPSLAGQPSFYATTQLFLFREGRRSNASMTAIAKGMSDADMRAFSDLVGALPPAPATTDTGEPDRMRRGSALATQYRCTSCHGDDLAGTKQVPRLAGQREDYLNLSLVEFRAGSRLGYTGAMAEALAGIPPDELRELAYFLARAAAPVSPRPSPVRP